MVQPYTVPGNLQRFALPDLSADSALTRVLKWSPIGDANLDGVVDGLDFILWNDNKFSAVAAWSHGDFSADGIVDGQDFVAWNQNKFTSSEQLSTVPEPGLFIWWNCILALPRFRTRVFFRVWTIFRRAD